LSVKKLAMDVSLAGASYVGRAYAWGDSGVHSPRKTPGARARPEGRSGGIESMSTQDDEDNTTYKVVINHEEQYSIWPADRDNPLGWRDGGKQGKKAECLAWIDEVWTDMRPLSLRKQMDAAEKS
jgi:MbtH protein